MLEAHRDWGAFRGKSEAELLAWLKTILTRNLLNVARHYGAKKCDVGRELSLQAQIDQSSARLDKFLASGEASPSQYALHQERVQQLATALSQLLDDERTAVTLKHFHGKSLAEIAEHLGRSKTAVAGLLRRGLVKLRTFIHES
jgi:RNA polymerase sigma-70 factor (ECF subfamily)